MPSVRRASPLDAFVIAQHRSPDLKAGDPALMVYVDWVVGALARDVYVGFLAVEDDAVVAGAGLTLLEWGPTRHDPSPLVARLVNVYTAPTFRRRGLARDLTSRALDEAGRRGIRSISLATTPEARALYETLGFRAYAAEMRLRLEPPGA
ncbi:GNAT family N-acetyltransferase [Deinococcus pimensis]|uniref:GNAT family N-acetyltransferase n=1 Tax=Deinococcus pimensis TaxID=309888 RepID=UPI00047FED0C|nr:GNAT family N-acetyltransferase [Deinococcus pimensis]